MTEFGRQMRFIYIRQLASFNAVQKLLERGERVFDRYLLYAVCAGIGDLRAFENSCLIICSHYNHRF